MTDTAPVDNAGEIIGHEPCSSAIITLYRELMEARALLTAFKAEAADKQMSTADYAREQRARAESAERERDEAVAALKPFADAINDARDREAQANGTP